MGWDIVEERTFETMQPVVEQAPPAAHYYSDGFCVYPTLLYQHGKHRPLPNKSQTYSVEGGNADLRHYLARLGRKSRCFSRCLEALRRAVWLLVFCYNRRQLFKRRYPKLPAHLIDFLPVNK